MPEHLRALVVILALATVVFVFAKAPACAVAMRPADFERRRNLWFAMTLVAFLAHNFWVFVIAGAALLLFAVPREPNKLAMFFFLLFAVSPMSAEIPGVGGIRYFFAVDYVRLLSLVVLFPAFLALRRQPDVERFGRTLPDKFIAAYIILNLLLMLTVSTFTNTLRHGFFYAFVNIFLPYYVASRSLKNLQDFRDALMAFVVAALVLSAIGAFEFVRHWLLYSVLDDTLGVRARLGSYLLREENLRALGSVGHPIVFGYVIAVAAGMFLYLRKLVPNPLVWILGLALLTTGLVVSLSRGPWVGAAAMMLVFVATGRAGGLRVGMIALLAIAISPLLLLSPAGERIISYLPFVGTVDETTVTYRHRLLEIAVQVIMRNPFFGAFDSMYSPAMQELKTGEGIIDIVNSYLGVGLQSGLVGLSLYFGFFVVIGVGIFRNMRRVADKDDEHYRIGQVLLATLVGILVIIFTVSSISVIPVIYWSVAGLGVAYSRMLAVAREPAVSGAGFYSATMMKIKT